MASRKYGLFARPRGSKKGTRWKRVFSYIEGTKDQVVRRSQLILIAACFSGPDVVEVRPLPRKEKD